MKKYKLTIKYSAEKPIYPFDTVTIVKTASQSYSNVLTLLEREFERLSIEGNITPTINSENIAQTTPIYKRTI
jgi:hypothetical protein